MAIQPYCRGRGAATTAGVSATEIAATGTAVKGVMAAETAAAGTMVADGIDGGCKIDAGAAVMDVKGGTLDDVEEDLRVDVGVNLTGGAGLVEPGARLAATRWRRSAIRSRTDTVLAEGAGLLEPGARLAITRWRRSAIRSRTDAVLTEGAMLARDLCWC